MFGTPCRRIVQVALVLALFSLATPSARAQLSDILNGGPLGQAVGGAGAASPESIVTIECAFHGARREP